MEPSPSFEDAIAELTQIVQTLERGQPTLDESLARFERGVELLRQCRQQLDAAECRVKELVEIDEHGHAKLREFDHQATVEKAKGDRTASKKKKAAKDPEPVDIPIEEKGLFE
jgi:exodeoxyribonuclease VII small subunit